jgi:putative ABC transport system permease protein
MRHFARLSLSPLVLVYQSVRLALSQIWANKLRGVLTTLGILIGVAAVSSVIALISGMRDRVLAEFDAFGAKRIVVQPHFRQKDLNKGTYEQVVFKNSDFDEMLARCPSVESFTRNAGYGRMGASHGTESDEDAWFHSVDPQWHQIELQDVDNGRPLTEMDLQQARRICLVNQRVIEKLKLNSDPSGQFVDVPYFGRLLIVGSLEPPPGMSVSDLRNGEIVVPFTFSTHKYFWPTWYTVTANSKSREQTGEAKAEIEFYLRQKRHIAPADEPTFQIETSERQIAQINETARMVTTIAGGIVAVSLLVAGVGIMNIMLVSVSERTREIGLRKAVGARPGAICMQFLLEAVVLCLIGGLLGIVLGQVITTIVSSQLPTMREHGKMIHIDHLNVPPSAIALSLGFSAFIGLTFGFFPAIKAASLDPIEALRHE